MILFFFGQNTMKSKLKYFSLPREAKIGQNWEKISLQMDASLGEKKKR